MRAVEILDQEQLRRIDAAIVHIQGRSAGDRRKAQSLLDALTNERAEILRHHPKSARKVPQPLAA